jgi:hypothetical protein
VWRAVPSSVAIARSECPFSRNSIRTVEKIAEAVGMTWTPTHTALRKLETRRPQLAHPDVDAKLNITFWRATHEAADAIGDG